MKVSLAVTALAALALVGAAGAQAAPQSKPAPAGAKPQRTCFDPNFIEGYSSREKGSVDVRSRPNEVFRLTLSPGCPDIDWPLAQIAMVSKTGGSVCSAHDVEFVVRSGVVPQRCFATAMRRLTPDEIAATKIKKKR